MQLAIDFAAIQQAAVNLRGVAHRTPVMTSRQADQITGAQLFFKCENFQRVGAFKLRGAYNALYRLSPEQRAGGVLAYSSGNHAQAVALAGQLLQIKTCIVMPHDAPALKLAATRGYGAEVILYQRGVEDREQLSAAIAAERGMTIIPPFDHPDVMAGQGTAALELLQETGALDYLFVCVGGGGLLAGCATAAATMAPDCHVIGVEPEAGNDVQQSLASGQLVQIPVPDTIADGAQTQQAGRLTFPVIQRHVRQIVTVSDAQLCRQMHFFAERMKMIVEPTGCLAAAAALNRVIDISGKRVGVVVSGGNVDLARFATLINLA